MMPERVKLQILYLMKIYEMTSNQYIAECLSWLWKDIKVNREHANELPKWRMTKVKEIVGKTLDVNPEEDITNFIQRTAPHMMALNRSSTSISSHMNENKINQQTLLKNTNQKVLKSA